MEEVGPKGFATATRSIIFIIFQLVLLIWETKPFLAQVHMHLGDGIRSKIQNGLLVPHKIETLFLSHIRNNTHLLNNIRSIMHQSKYS